MYIPNRPLSAGYKFLTAIIAALGFWLLIQSYPGSAVTYLATFVTLFAAVYFLLATFKVLFGHRHHPWRAFCPVWHGTLVLGGLLVLITQLVAALFPDAALQVPLGPSALLASLVLPLLILFDWILFSKKSTWRFVDPWYWLCLPLVYLALNYFLIGTTVSDQPLVYPYGFVDYLTMGVIPTLIWTAGVFGGALLLGYFLTAADRALRPREATATLPVSTATKPAPTPPEPSPAPSSAAEPTSGSAPAAEPVTAPEPASDSASAAESAAAPEPTSAEPTVEATSESEATSAAESQPAPATRPQLVDVRPAKAAKTAKAAKSSKPSKSAKAAAKSPKTPKSPSPSKSSKSPKSAKPVKSSKPAKSIKVNKDDAPAASAKNDANSKDDSKSTRRLHGNTQVGD